MIDSLKRWFMPRSAPLTEVDAEEVPFDIPFIPEPEPEPEPEKGSNDDAPRDIQIDQPIANIFTALGDGDFKTRLIEEEHPLAGITNPALDAVDNAVSEVLALADLLAKGDLTTGANGVYKGDLALMRDALNTIRSGLTTLIGDAREAGAKVGTKSRELADLTSSLSAQSNQQNQIAHAVGEQISTLKDVGETLSSAVGESVKTTGLATETSQKGYERSVEAVDAINRMRKGSQEIAVMLALIEDIAQQTNLLAINASIEAARAGPAGAGFLVVSAEVKALADRSSEATEQIRKTTRTIELAVGDCASAIDECGVLLEEVTGGLKQLGVISQSVGAASEAQKDAVSRAENESKKLSETASAGTAATNQAEAMAYDLAEIVKTLGANLSQFQLHDTEMTEHTQRRALEVSRAFERGIKNGIINEADLFATEYELVPNSDPKQYTTRFTEFVDQAAGDVVESAFDIGAGVIFSAVMNREGYLAVNSRKFSKPPRPHDPAWSAANSRNRRFFKDRVGMGVSTSQNATLLQAYRRDMGGGSFVTMKDISAPIFVNGRHWGGLRIGYKSGGFAAEAAPAQEFKRSA